ncbi:MAG: hypothetical protein QW222_06270 [Candidatus Bathyarchaeia archaeon]
MVRPEMKFYRIKRFLLLLIVVAFFMDYLMILGFLWVFIHPLVAIAVAISTFLPCYVLALRLRDTIVEMM